MITAMDDVTRLRSLIDDAMKQGDHRLPPEPKLGEALGVSRGRLRTMLKRLESEGLIWRHVGKGTFIGPRRTSDDRDWLTLISGSDVLEARQAFEPQLAASAAIRATPLDHAAMENCLAEMAESRVYAQWKRLDEKLHRIIAESARNAVLLALYDLLAQAKLVLDARVPEVFGMLAEPRRAADREHEAVVKAIRMQDPQGAEQAMRDHLASVRSVLFGLR